MKRIPAPGISTLDAGYSLSLRPQDRRPSGRSGEVYSRMKTILVRNITACAASLPMPTRSSPPQPKLVLSGVERARYPLLLWLRTSKLVNVPWFLLLPRSPLLLSALISAIVFWGFFTAKLVWFGAFPSVANSGAIWYIHFVVRDMNSIYFDP